MGRMQKLNKQKLYWNKTKITKLTVLGIVKYMEYNF